MVARAAGRAVWQAHGHKLTGGEGAISDTACGEHLPLTLPLTLTFHCPPQITCIDGWKTKGALTYQCKAPLPGRYVLVRVSGSPCANILLSLMGQVWLASWEGRGHTRRG